MDCGGTEKEKSKLRYIYRYFLLCYCVIDKKIDVRTVAEEDGQIGTDEKKSGLWTMKQSKQ